MYHASQCVAHVLDSLATLQHGGARIAKFRTRAPCVSSADIFRRWIPMSRCPCIHAASVSALPLPMNLPLVLEIEGLQSGSRKGPGSSDVFVLVSPGKEGAADASFVRPTQRDLQGQDIPSGRVEDDGQAQEVVPLLTSREQRSPAKALA